MTKEVQEIITSTDVRVKVKKNKVSPPFREATVRVRFGRGFDNFWTALQILLANKKIMHATGMYYFHNVEVVGLAPEWMARATTGTNRPYIRGADNLLAQADVHAEWRDAIIVLAEQVVIENVDAMSKVTPVREVPEEEFEDSDDLGELESVSTGSRVDI
jgi:RecA/RadA recombinase